MDYYMYRDLSPTLASDTYTYTANNGASGGDRFYTHITMQNLSGYYKVGTVTISTNFSGGRLNVRTGTSMTDVGQSGQIISGQSWSFTANYLRPTNYIVIEIPQEIREVFTITFSFTALDTGNNYRATYTVNSTQFVYDGQSHTCVRSLSHCYYVAGTNTATAIGQYQYTIKANNSYIYSACYYFEENTGSASSMKEIDWEIVATPTGGGVEILRSGAWHNATPYVLSNGTWRQGQAYVLTNGTWHTN